MSITIKKEDNVAQIHYTVKGHDQITSLLLACDHGPMIDYKPSFAKVPEVTFTIKGSGSQQDPELRTNRKKVIDLLSANHIAMEDTGPHWVKLKNPGDLKEALELLGFSKELQAHLSDVLEVNTRNYRHHYPVDQQFLGSAVHKGKAAGL